MARQIDRLNTKLVAKLTQPGRYPDGLGLYLQVSRTGTKSWFFRYERAGKQKEMGLGSIHTFDLSQARERAKAARERLADGIDPMAHRNAERAAQVLEQSNQVSFDDCATAYIRAHRPKWTNALHAAEWERSLARYASPVFGSLPVSAVDGPLVLRVLQPIWVEKYQTASRLRGRIESVLAWSIASGFRKEPNPAKWEGLLEHSLPSMTKRIVEGHAALKIDDVPGFISGLQQIDNIAARALEFAALTAARTGEVQGAKWAEIDLDNAVWRIPANRMKAKREHRIPLSERAIQLLKSMIRVQGNDHVFPGRNGALGAASLLRVTKKLNESVTTHGLRSSFRDWCAERTNFPREVAEQALAHTVQSKVEASYFRSDVFEKRRTMMEQWAAFLTTPPQQQKVLQFKTGT